MTASSVASRFSTPRILIAYATLTLPIAGVYALVSFSAVPADGAEFWYWPVAWYNASAWSLMVACGLGVLVVLMIWGLWVMSKAPHGRMATLGAALAVAASGLMCWASLPLGSVTYRHIDTAPLDGQTYQLGVRLGLDGNNAYIVSACAGLMCRARYLPQAGRPDFTELPELLADPTEHTLAIQVGEQILYTYRP